MDVALHDLAAQRLGVSLAELLGGPAGEQRVPTDVTVSSGDPTSWRRRPRRRTERGVHGPQAQGRHRRRHRRGPGTCGPRRRPRRPIRVDANQGWTADEAIKVIRALEDAGLGIEFVEQPVERYDLAGLARVTDGRGHPGDGGRVGVRACATWTPSSRSRPPTWSTSSSPSAAVSASARALLERARAAGMGTIVGSMMEGPIGVGAAAALWPPSAPARSATSTPPGTPRRRR